MPSFDNQTIIIYCLLAFALLVLLAAVCVFSARMLSARRFEWFYALFLLLPAGQLVIAYSFLYDGWTAWWIAGVTLNLAANVVLVLYVISQEKKAALEDELAETKHRMELNLSHNNEVQKRREELEKIRGDFKHQLAAVSRYIRAGDENAVRELLGLLSTQINETRDHAFCAVPVINAVLAEKNGECVSAGIILEAELDIPSRLSVEQMHLCSIFGNLLDNSIAACKLLGRENAVIRLSSKIDGDYLFIKAANPAPEPNARPARRGYGSRILSDLAGRYGGAYQYSYQDGVFTSVVSLLAFGQ